MYKRQPEKPANVAAIVLAAGKSSRMEGRNKLLENIAEQPILGHVLSALTSSQVDRCVLVTGHQAELVKQCANQYKIEFVHNEHPELGISSSIKAGLAFLGKEHDAVLIVLADMPDISSTIIDTLIASFNSERDAGICIPTFKGQRGNPVLWSSSFFSKLLNVEGDLGGKQIIFQCEEAVCECEVDSNAIHEDIDDLSELNQRRLKDLN